MCLSPMRVCVRVCVWIMSVHVCTSDYTPLIALQTMLISQTKAKPPRPEETLNPLHISSLNYACSFVVAENASHSDYVKTVLAI